MQPKKRTAKTASTDPVGGWMELMSEWDALSAELEEMRAASGVGDTLPHAKNAGPTNAEVELLARMQTLKEQINGFLGKAARQRQPVNGPLVMGTLLSSADKQSVARYATPKTSHSGEETD